MRLPLSGVPAPASIVVTVDGETSTAWSYDATSNEIVFETVKDGATVEATYTLARECP